MQRANAVKQMNDNKPLRSAAATDEEISATETPTIGSTEPPIPEAASSPPVEKNDGIVLGRLCRVDRRYIKTETFGWWIVTIIIALVEGIPLLVLSIRGVGPTWLRMLLIGLWGGLLLLLYYLSRRVPVCEYRRTRYRVTSLGIEIRKGIIWRQVINVPRNRVQHTDVVQGPLLRHYKLASLVIHTAGTTHAIVTLPGLSRARALQLRDFLIRREQSHDD